MKKKKLKENKGLGLYEQMMNAPTETYYNNISLERLTEFAIECGFRIDKEGEIVYPNLTLEQLQDYAVILHKVKSGFLYHIGSTSSNVNGGRRLIMTTGYKGCKGYIKSCIKSNIPPQLVIPDIVIIDYETNISARLMDVKFERLTKTKLD